LSLFYNFALKKQKKTVQAAKFCSFCDLSDKIQQQFKINPSTEVNLWRV